MLFCPTPKRNISTTQAQILNSPAWAVWVEAWVEWILTTFSACLLSNKEAAAASAGLVTEVDTVEEVTPSMDFKTFATFEDHCFNDSGGSIENFIYLHSASARHALPALDTWPLTNVQAKT